MRQPLRAFLRRPQGWTEHHRKLQTFRFVNGHDAHRVVITIEATIQHLTCRTIRGALSQLLERCRNLSRAA